MLPNTPASLLWQAKAGPSGAKEIGIIFTTF
jgi:hypothetical protein